MKKSTSWGANAGIPHTTGLLHPHGLQNPAHNRNSATSPAADDSFRQLEEQDERSGEDAVARDIRASEGSRLEVMSQTELEHSPSKSDADLSNRVPALSLADQDYQTANLEDQARSGARETSTWLNAGSSQLCWVEGKAGSGKSTLLSHMQELARRNASWDAITFIYGERPREYAVGSSCQSFNRPEKADKVRSVLRRLLEAPVDIEDPSPCGRAPLHWAVSHSVGGSIAQLLHSGRQPWLIHPGMWRRDSPRTGTIGGAAGAGTSTEETTSPAPYSHDLVGLHKASSGTHSVLRRTEFVVFDNLWQLEQEHDGQKLPLGCDEALEQDVLEQPQHRPRRSPPNAWIRTEYGYRCKSRRRLYRRAVGLGNVILVPPLLLIVDAFVDCQPSLSYRVAPRSESINLHQDATRLDSSAAFVAAGASAAVLLTEYWRTSDHQHLRTWLLLTGLVIWIVTCMVQRHEMPISILVRLPWTLLVVFVFSDVVHSSIRGFGQGDESEDHGSIETGHLGRDDRDDTYEDSAWIEKNGIEGEKALQDTQL